MLISLFIAFSALAHEHPLPEAAAKMSMGSGLYRTCYYCHSLEPGVQLTGPSLANLWGAPAGQVKGFDLYSDALKSSKLKWDEATLKKWLANPHAVVPATTMTFAGYKSPEQVDAIVQFLKIAMGADGLKKTVAQKLLTDETARGQTPKEITSAPIEDQVLSIEHCADHYTVTTADKKTSKYWDQNLDLKVASGLGAPPKEKPVRISTGSMGDRFEIVFRSVDEIPKFVRECGRP